MSPTSKEKKFTDEEIQKIIEETKKISVQDEFFNIPEIPVEKSPEIDIQNPDKSHKLYYSTYQRLLKKYLRPEKEFKKINSLIRYEANFYLKDGKKSGRDGRQAYTNKLTIVCNNIIAWVNDGNKLDFAGLYQKLKNLNSNIEEK
jgi:hypothetical protein